MNSSAVAIPRIPVRIGDIIIRRKNLSDGDELFCRKSGKKIINRMKELSMKTKTPYDIIKFKQG